jgi:Txe/YoeB family toxin of toxin-antitoxin system
LVASGWALGFTSQADKDAKHLKAAGLKEKVEVLLAILERDPYQNPPPYEKLRGDMEGAYSRRINRQHRLVYEVVKAEKLVKVIRLWSHYE